MLNKMDVTKKLWLICVKFHLRLIILNYGLIVNSPIFKRFMYIILISFLITINLKNNFWRIFDRGINTPAIKDFCWMVEDLTYLLKLIQRFNYL